MVITICSESDAQDVDVDVVDVLVQAECLYASFSKNY